MPKAQFGRAMPRAWSFVLFHVVPVALVLVWSADAHAYTWMIRHGYGGCTNCHTDPSGGEMLTPYGRAQGDLLLRMHYGKDTESGQASEPAKTTESFDSFDSFDSDSETKGDSKGAAKGDAKSDDGAGSKGQASGEAKAAAKPQKSASSKAEQDNDSDVPRSAGFMWGLFDTPPWLLLGGGYRHSFLYVPSKPSGDQFRTFPMQADLYGELIVDRFHAGGTLGVAKVQPGSPYAHAAQITTNQGYQYNLISRTHFIGYDIGAKREWMLRAGRLNLPFGVRIPEHIMWVRDFTHTNREAQQEHGVALAFNGDNVRAEVMGIAGNYQLNPDKYRQRGYSGYVEVAVAPKVAAGVSSMVTTAQSDFYTLEDAKTVRGAHGPFARVVISKPLVALVEADALHTSRRSLGYVGFLQLDYELVQGLHFQATGEALDEGFESKDLAGNSLARAPGAGKPRWGGWGTVDWFFLPHLEARVDAITRQNPAPGQKPDFQLLGQLHFYL